MGFPCPYISPLPGLPPGGGTLDNYTLTGTVTATGATITGADAILAAAAGYIGFVGRSRIYSSGDGNLQFRFADGVTAANISAAQVTASTNLVSTAGYVQTTKGYLGGSLKTLAESSATTIFDITCAAGAWVAGELHIAIEAKDATDTQVRHMRVPFTAVATAAGTVSSTLGTPVETVTVSSGTLTCTITITDGAGKITLNANAVSSLTQTTLQAKSMIVSPQDLTITAL